MGSRCRACPLRRQRPCLLHLAQRRSPPPRGPRVSVRGPAPHTRVAFGRFLAHGRAHGPTFSRKPTPSQKPGLKGGEKLTLISRSWPPPASEVGLKSPATLGT